MVVYGQQIDLHLSTSVVTIGFNGTYSMSEDAASIMVTVLVLMNSLARDVSVTLSTSDDIAMGRAFDQLDRHRTNYITSNVLSQQMKSVL